MPSFFCCYRFAFLLSSPGAVFLFERPKRNRKSRLSGPERSYRESAPQAQCRQRPERGARPFLCCPSPNRRWLNGGNRSAELFVLLAGGPFFFRHRKKKQERCHRSGSVDDGQTVFPSGLPPAIKSHLSRQVLLPALPCRPGGTVFPWPVGCWRFCCAGADGSAFFLGKALRNLVQRCIWPIRCLFLSCFAVGTWHVALGPQGRAESSRQ